MSLIGPRPESLNWRTALTYSSLSQALLDASCLSGWAQVCSPYASSIEASNLKLSYDLYYADIPALLDIVSYFPYNQDCAKARGRELGVLNVMM